MDGGKEGAKRKIKGSEKKAKRKRRRRNAIEQGQTNHRKKEAEGEMEATPTAKLNKKDSLAFKGELGIKRRAWRGGREELRLPTYG